MEPNKFTINDDREREKSMTEVLCNCRMLLQHNPSSILHRASGSAILSAASAIVVLCCLSLPWQKQRPDMLETYFLSSSRAGQRGAWRVRPWSSNHPMSGILRMRQQMLGERVGDGSIEVSLDPESIKRGGYVAWVNPGEDEDMPATNFAPPSVTLGARDRRYGAYMVWKNKGEVTCFDGGVPHGCPPEEDAQQSAREVVRISPRDAKRGSTVQWKDAATAAEEEEEENAGASKFEPIKVSCSDRNLAGIDPPPCVITAAPSPLTSKVQKLLVAALPRPRHLTPPSATLYRRDPCVEFRNKKPAVSSERREREIIAIGSVSETTQKEILEWRAAVDE
eukprot:340371-Hanusia_phi.AAC.2